jgi:hypothetical protein
VDALLNQFSGALSLVYGFSGTPPFLGDANPAVIAFLRIYAGSYRDEISDNRDGLAGLDRFLGTLEYTYTAF